MQAVSLGDCLTFNPSDEVSFECNLPGWSAERSLVSRVVARLQEVSGRQKGTRITIAKRIPLASGLGGDASDAATGLLGLNELWQLRLPPEQLIEIAAGLGSDVPFFLRAGTALSSGRGEVVYPLPVPVKNWLVILSPAISRPPEKTAALYARLSAADYTSGEYTDVLASNLSQGVMLANEPLYNVFERVAYDVFPGLEHYRQLMLAAGVSRVHLAGAGPSLFSLHSSQAEAEVVYLRLAGQPVFLTETLGSDEPGSTND